MNWEEALQIVSRATHPIAVISIGLIVAAFAFSLTYRARKTRIAWLLATSIILLALAPLAASTYLQAHGVYRVRILAQTSTHQPISDATLKCSIGGEIKKARDNWELEISPQVLPRDRKVTLYAARTDAYEAGSATVELHEDFYPSVVIQLASLPSVTLRGMVKDYLGRSVSKVRVSVPGYRDVAITDQVGNFELPAHVAAGQMVNVHAENSDGLADVLVPAGAPIEVVLRQTRN